MNLLMRFSRLRLARISFVVGLVIALGFAAGWSRPKNANDDIMPMFNLKSGELITIAQDKMGKGEMSLKMNGEDYVIDYAFKSNRSKDFRLLVQQKNGELVEQVAPSVSTFRGSLRGVEDSRVVGCMTEGGCCAKIEFPTGDCCYVEPVRQAIDNPAFAGVHVVYTEDQVLAKNGTCGAHKDPEEAQQSPATAPSVTAIGPLEECELFVDTDFEYFSFFGSTEATLTQIELIINVMNDQYEAEVGIRHTISTAVIRAVDSDTFLATAPGELLNELRLEHRLPEGFDGDLCHLFTGKELDEDVIGIAFFNGVCSQTNGFGLSQNIAPLSDMTDLVAHELGHNWNQRHCDCVTNTMNPFITGANSFSETDTIPSLLRYRDTRRFCLTEITPPVNDDLANKTVIDNALTGDTSFSVTGSNSEATTEGGEPNIVGVGSSVWWSVNASRDGTITIDTSGSDFDTQLTVYESFSDGGLENLELLAENDNVSEDELQSEITINVITGTQYEIRVGGGRSSESISDGSEGSIALNGSFIATPVLLGDVNQDGAINFLDLSPFIGLLSNDEYQAEADIDESGELNFADIGGFIGLLSGS